MKKTVSALFIFLYCSASFATTTTVTSVWAGRFAGQQTTVNDSDPTHSLLEISKSAIEGGTGAGIAEATASYGTLRADAGGLGGGYANGGGSAQASYSDFLKFEAAGMAGKEGSTTLNFWFNWDLLSASAGMASAITIGTINVSSGNRSSSRGTSAFANSSNGTDSVTNSATNNGAVVPFSFYIPLDIVFIYGSEFSVNASLHVQAGAQGMGPDQFGRVNGSAFAQANAGRSLHWAGFTDTMANNNLITDFTVTSRSGTDWLISQVPEVNAVPEPDGALLFIIGTFALLWAAAAPLSGATGYEAARCKVKKWFLKPN